MKTVLYYLYDPMCSWCWGFKPVWDELRERLQGELDIVYVVGGLAPETHTPMPVEMQTYLQQTWRKVTEHTGVSFNHDFWSLNTPKRSTYPACKAVLVARQSGLELEMYAAIQQLYYQKAGNPSDYENLYQLSEDLGLERQRFIEQIHSDEIDTLLQQEIMLTEQLGAQGFPSLVLQYDRIIRFIEHNYTDVEDNLRKIRSLIK
ncbi:MAG: DsbA family protein [Halobacteria archaeon]|nr:DsbA family protein [Halobacteria archaeon]